MLEKETPKNRNRISKPNKGYFKTEQKPQKRSKRWRNRQTENPNAFLLTSWLIYPVGYPGCQRRFFSLGATELSGEAMEASREAARHYSLADQYY